MMSSGVCDLQRLVQLVGQALAVAVDDPVLQPALDRLGPHLLDGVGGLAVGEHLQQALQRVVALAPAVEEQVLHDLHLLGGDQVQRADLADVHDGRRHAGADGVVEEHGVQHGARRRVEAEADVGQAEHDLHVRELVADQLDALERPLAELAVVLVAGGDGEGQRVDQQVGLRQAVLVAGDADQPPGDVELGLRRLGHAGLVDGQRDHRGAELLGERQPVARGASRRPRS